MAWGEQLLEQPKKMWGNFTLWQRGSLLAIAAAALAGILFLAYYAQKPSMEALYTNLDPSDASAIAAKLKEQKVNYQLADEGRSILVPAGEKYQLRLDMAGQVNLRGVVGFESFNQTRFGETDTDKRVRFLIALQGELTRTIEEMAEVETAKVHLALPTPSLFLKDEKEATASVLLRLKPYAQIKPEQVKSIMDFVSHSVEGLKPANVTVMDVNGNLLSEGLSNTGTAIGARISANQLAIKQQAESELARSVQSMLERMRGAGKAVVRANIAMDFDQVEKRSEQVGEPVLISEQSKEESSSGKSAVSGGNPVDANTGGPSYGSAGSANGTQYQLTERTRNYEVSKTTETKVSAPGKITKVSLSVLIDGELTPQEQGKLSDAVSKAAGIDAARGDQVSLVGIAFDDTQAKKLADEIVQVEKKESRTFYMKVGAGILGVILIGSLLIFALRKIPLAAVYAREARGMAQTAAAAAGYGAGIAREVNVPNLVPEMTEKKLKKAQIEKLAESNPEDVVNVIKTWLIEE